MAEDDAVEAAGELVVEAYDNHMDILSYNFIVYFLLFIPKSNKKRPVGIDEMSVKLKLSMENELSKY